VKDDIKKRALNIYHPPFRAEHGYIFDVKGGMVADQAPADSVVRTRGWGDIQYMDDPEELQDAISEYIAQALTEYWERNTSAKPTP